MVFERFELSPFVHPADSSVRLKAGIVAIVDDGRHGVNDLLAVQIRTFHRDHPCGLSHEALRGSSVLIPDAASPGQSPCPTAIRELLGISLLEGLISQAGPAVPVRGYDLQRVALRAEQLRQQIRALETRLEELNRPQPPRGGRVGQLAHEFLSCHEEVQHTLIELERLTAVVETTAQAKRQAEAQVRERDRMLPQYEAFLEAERRLRELLPVRTAAQAAEAARHDVRRLEQEIARLDLEIRRQQVRAMVADPNAVDYAELPRQRDHLLEQLHAAQERAEHGPRLADLAKLQGLEADVLRLAPSMNAAETIDHARSALEASTREHDHALMKVAEAHHRVHQLRDRLARLPFRSVSEAELALTQLEAEASTAPTANVAELEAQLAERRSELARLESNPEQADRWVGELTALRDHLIIHAPIDLSARANRHLAKLTGGRPWTVELDEEFTLQIRIEGHLIAVPSRSIVQLSALAVRLALVEISRVRIQQTWKSLILCDFLDCLEEQLRESTVAYLDGLRHLFAQVIVTSARTDGLGRADQIVRLPH